MNSSEFKVNLLWLSEGEGLPDWDLGEVFICSPEPDAIHEVLKAQLPFTAADAWLFWEGALGVPPTKEKLQGCLAGAADAWHAGLLVGLSGQPKLIDFVQPTWMLNRDPDPEIEASSWRLSLRACLVRTEVLRQLGGPGPHFASLAGASLELGFRYIRNGAFVRHCPYLLSSGSAKSKQAIPLADQLRFIHAGFERRWLGWAVFRAFLTGEAGLIPLWRAWREVKADAPVPRKSPYQRPEQHNDAQEIQGRVSVLIPTLRRYPYLRTLLDQLREQTIPPLEILVIDQTPSAMRDEDLLADYADFPLRYLTLDQAGQSSARNLGLNNAEGNYILFLDDDVEAPPNLIESHLRNLEIYQSNVSSGVVYEKDSDELPEYFRFLRISNVFPGGNSMIKKNILNKSGLFDLAYDQGQRADHDLGMRFYLSGEMMILDPSIAILHHHAPMGGLREHDARVNTRAASRQHLFKHNLPTVSDIFQGKRYFLDNQVKEIIWISILGTFSIKGSYIKRFLKILIGFLFLPVNLFNIFQMVKKADAMMDKFPKIPDYSL